MKRRLIINIQDDCVSDAEATFLVEDVILKGRISKTADRNHYCHLTLYGLGQNEIAVSAACRKKGTDTFTIWERKK